MYDQHMNPITLENIDQFDVWVSNSRDLVVFILPVSAPWNAFAESYQIEEQDEQ